MDPEELVRVSRRAESDGKTIKVIYHSHPNHGAYFSKEDRDRAMAWDDPVYPDATHFVLSVWNAVFRDAKAFRWNNQTRDFVEVPWRERRESRRS